ncbi:MAG: DUF5694 domain-containing protein [Panacibacter sp.]
MRKFFCCIASLFLLFSVSAQNKQPVKVLLLGVFHFDNPGLDVAKFASADILSEQRQKEVMQIVEKLKNFSPDKIFIEGVPENKNSIDSTLDQYKKGKYTLSANEIDQLGLRLAKELNHPAVYPVDYRDADFPFDSLMKSAADAGQTDIINFVQHIIDTVQTSFNEALQKSTITQMLLRENTPESIKLQNEFYFSLLPAGKQGNHVGSYLVSEWWRRNMIIYENILKRLDGNEKAILIMFGSGHTALLNQMMRYNANIELVNVADVLE